MRSKKEPRCCGFPDPAHCPVFLIMKTAFAMALLMYGIAFVISMLVALLVKGLFLLVRRLSEP